ncbi:MAG: Coenzyme F420 hydrogenase/dehydrogenase, beta subunit C-terminal domain, partial [Firmicutes bacterium]|nr:Coenzyme F420 hydrogenase/dehydrogenase, beta subunit C-terminal domain [Bacillota bacterium]
ITIGDYWGVEKHHPEFSTKDGVSLVIANTEKGRVFINEMKEHTHYLESNINIASLENNNLYQPTNRPRLRNEIYNGILEMSDSQYIKQRLMPQITVVDKLRSYVPHLIINFYHTIKRFIVW